MQGVYFKTESSPPVRVYCTSDGRIDFSALGDVFVLEPKSIQLNGTGFPLNGLESVWTWEEIEKIFKMEGEPVGTKGNPVKVTGKPPVHEASTENLAKALSGPPTIMRRYKEQAPSSFDLHTVRRVQNHGDGPLFRCDRSHLGTLPGPLLHPIFGEFEDNLQNSTLLTREDHSFVKELCDTST
ncbi:hypothetical protein M758_10G133500 [Ceratodon purpureus]|nr:hypothetical protein M758_10G133500 [Ceratodon purpureus]